jgi:hypothetical protein
MQFTIQRPDGTIARVQHIPYTVAQTGPSEWIATRKDGKTPLGRSTVSEAHLRAHCDTMTEPVKNR